MITSMGTVDTSDTQRALVNHVPDGELYIIEYCSIWQDNRLAGTRILRAAGPIYYGYLTPHGGPIEPSTALFDRIDRYVLTEDDADWLQSEDAEGRLRSAIPSG